MPRRAARRASASLPEPPNRCRAAAAPHPAQPPRTITITVHSYSSHGTAARGYPDAGAQTEPRKVEMPYARTFPRRRRWSRRGYTRRYTRRRSRPRGLAILAAVAIVLILIALTNSH